MDFYRTFSKKALSACPDYIQIGDYRVEYMAFSPNVGHSTSGVSRRVNIEPALVLSGDFQHFMSYREFIPKLYKTRPVIIVSLPSYGGNEQRADELSIFDMANLLNQFLEVLSIPVIDLISFSLTSLMAHEFSIRFPEKTNNLVMSGIMAFPRSSFLLKMKQSIRMMDEDFDGFSDALLLYLFSPRYLSEDESETVYETRPTLKKLDSPGRRLLRQQIKQLDDNQKAQYKSNISRALNYLMDIEGCNDLGDEQDESHGEGQKGEVEGEVERKGKMKAFPKSRTLVLAGEFDHFVLPFEGANYTNYCEYAEFVLIKNADHLVQINCPETVLALINNFLQNKALNKIPGVMPLRYEDMDHQGKRSSLRREPKTSQAWLLSDSLRMHQMVSVKDINFSGGLMELPGRCLKQATLANDLEIQFSGFELKLKISVFDKKKNIARFLFKHTDIEKARLLIIMLSNAEYFKPRGNGISHKLS